MPLALWRYGAEGERDQLSGGQDLNSDLLESLQTLSAGPKVTFDHKRRFFWPTRGEKCLHPPKAREGDSVALVSADGFSLQAMEATRRAESSLSQRLRPPDAGNPAGKEAGHGGDLFPKGQPEAHPPPYFDDALPSLLERFQSHTDFSWLTPKPPRRPRLERTSSLDELIWRRRRLFRMSQESLADPSLMGLSRGSLQGGSAGGQGTEPCVPRLRHREPPAAGLCQTSEAAYAGPSRLSLSPLPGVLHGQAPPPLELDGSFPSLRTANRIDPDYVDYRFSSQSAFPRAGSSWSDTQLHSRGMVYGGGAPSSSSMKSSFSLLTPIRVRDVRNR